MYKKLFLLFFLTILFFSCTKNDKDSSDFAWLGGEIINPKGDYILFYKGDQLLDSVKLDANNHFIYKIKEVSSGLYSFSHKEFQVFYLEPSDSLMLRVNTLDFDESLSYTGKGAAHNNFLMDMFLHNEKEIKLMPKLYSLSPQNFEKALDSLKNVRTNVYHDFIKKNNPSLVFKNIAEANINYDYYSKKEIYITANTRRKNTERYVKIPESFYNYRNDIDFGSESLRSYFPYYRFLFRYFNNLALNKNEESNNFEQNYLNNNLNKIKIIDSTITNDSLKNSMTKIIVGRYLLNCNNIESQKKILNLFLATNTNKTHREEIKEIAKASMMLTPGNKIPNLFLITTENTIKDLHGITNNPTVFYFWSNKSISNYKNVHLRVSELKLKFPKYNFIGINTDSNYKNWLNLVNASGYDKRNEYQFENSLKAEKKLIIYAINKAVIVDKNAIIIDASSNLFNLGIEKSLSGYLKK